MNKPEPTNHEQLLSLLLPLIEFMDNNEFSYFLVTGKDGVCSRFLEGKKSEIIPMLTDIAEKNPCVDKLLKSVVSEFMKTYWWIKNHNIAAKGGHYYFNTDIHADKEWTIKIETP